MLHEVRIPHLHVPECELTVVDVFASEGDFVVERLDALIEVETSKAVFQLDAPVNGSVIQVNVSPGDRVQRGDVVFVIDGSADLPGPVLDRWIAEFGCPVCGSRLVNRVTEWQNMLPLQIQNRKLVETGECNHCQIRAEREQHKGEGVWTRWSAIHSDP